MIVAAGDCRKLCRIDAEACFRRIVEVVRGGRRVRRMRRVGTGESATFILSDRSGLLVLMVRIVHRVVLMQCLCDMLASRTAFLVTGARGQRSTHRKVMRKEKSSPSFSGFPVKGPHDGRALDVPCPVSPEIEIRDMKRDTEEATIYWRPRQ
jgi:hypothetical protein